MSPYCNWSLIVGVNRNLAVYSDTEDAINIEGIVKTKFDVMQRSDPKSSLSYMKLKRYVLFYCNSAIVFDFLLLTLIF